MCSIEAMCLQVPLLLVLWFDFLVSATAFLPTQDNASALSVTPNLVKPSILSNASITTLVTSEDNTFNIRCDGETYGYNPNILDCESAKEYLHPDPKMWIFGERHTGLPEDIVPLPYRIMGDRGLCYVQAVLIGGHTTARATLNSLRRAATSLVVQCATSVVSQGGIATTIGKRSQRSFTDCSTLPGHKLHWIVDKRRWRQQSCRYNGNISSSNFLPRDSSLLGVMQRHPVRYACEKNARGVWSFWLSYCDRTSPQQHHFM